MLKAPNGKIHAGSLKTGPLCNRIPVDTLKTTTKGEVDCGLCLNVQRKRDASAAMAPIEKVIAAKPAKPTKAVEAKPAKTAPKTTRAVKRAGTAAKTLPKSLTRETPAGKKSYYISRSSLVTTVPEHGFWTTSNKLLTSKEIAELAELADMGPIGHVQGISFKWLVYIGKENNFVAICYADGPPPKENHRYDVKVITATGRAMTEGATKSAKPYASSWVLAEMYRALMTEVLADAHMAMLAEGL